MSTGIRSLAWVTVILSVILYRSGDLLLNIILIRSPFPSGYLAGGDYASDCVATRDHADQPAESLMFCEDETFWEVHSDAQGTVIERPVIVSCDPGRRAWNTVMGPLLNPKPRGGLWIYIPSSGTTQASGNANANATRLISPDIAPNKAHRITLKNFPTDHTFHPLGLEIWPSYSGNSSNLYVINHAREATVIEQFLMNPARPTEAEHIRTIRSIHFHSANGLALTSPDSFYVANDHLMTRRLPIVGPLLALIESLLALPLGFVSHITLHKPGSPESDHHISEAFFTKLFVPFANGIALSSSRTNVAVVATSMSEIWVYERDPATNELKHRKETIRLPLSPDNVHYYSSPTGVEEIIVGGHPNFPDLVSLAEGKTNGSASWVIAIVPKDDGNNERSRVFDQDAPVSMNSKIRMDGVRWTMKTLFQSDGIEEKGGFASSTTGLRDPQTGAFYVTGIYAKSGMMVCRPGSGNVAKRGDD